MDIKTQYRLARLAVFVTLVNSTLAVVLAVIGITHLAFDPMVTMLSILLFILGSAALFSEATRGIFGQVLPCKLVPHPKNPMMLPYCTVHESYQYNPSYNFCAEYLKRNS